LLAEGSGGGSGPDLIELRFLFTEQYEISADKEELEVVEFKK
jgi:hypothetical protein